MDYLYHAVKLLQDSGTDFILHFAGAEQGSNNYIGRFSQLLGERFVYEGVVSGIEKDKLLKTCDVFLLPSFYEGLPMSLLECMSFGMVPVTTNVGSISEFVHDGKTGLLLQMKDSQSIVDAINLLSKDTDLRRNLSKNAREKIFTALSTEKYISKLNEIYQNC
jgi:glycosyltransferase involved in cell wall biosynthesis